MGISTVVYCSILITTTDHLSDIYSGILIVTNDPQ